MSSKLIRIGKLTAADIPEVTRIYAEAINPSYIGYGELTEGLATLGTFSKDAPLLFQKEIRRFIRGGARRIYVAHQGKQPVGFTYVEIKKAAGGHRECWVLDLGVDKKFRRMGVAQHLLKAVYAFGRKQKVKYFFLESGEENKGAHHLFKQEGFSPLAITFVKENQS